MAVQIEDGIRDELARAMERRLPAAQSGVEVRGARATQVSDLRRGDGGELTSAAGVDGLELGCDDCWVW